MRKRRLVTKTLCVDKYAAFRTMQQLKLEPRTGGTVMINGEERWVYSIDLRSALHPHAMKPADAEVLMEILSAEGVWFEVKTVLDEWVGWDDYPALTWWAAIDYEIKTV